MPNMIVVADIGGTMTRVAASADGKTLSEAVVFNTLSDDFEAGIQKVIEAARTAAGGAAIQLVVAGIAGRFSEDHTVLLRSPHLLDWEGKNIPEVLRLALHASVCLQNDAALAALGEANAGAGVGVNTIAYITVGTGIGGRKVVGGRLDETSYKSVGHQLITIDGESKELEEFVSGSAIMRDHGGRASKIDNPAEWDRYARAFSYGVYNVIRDWEPERIVLGGTLCAPEMLSIPLIEKHLKEINHENRPIPELCYAKLPFPGLTGALIYANQMGI